MNLRELNLEELDSALDRMEEVKDGANAENFKKIFLWNNEYRKVEP